MAFHSGARKPFESGITKDQLFWWIDGHDPVGYPGSGTTMFDLVGSRNMTITGATHQTALSHWQPLLQLETVHRL